MLKRILITCLIALFGLACTRTAFVQHGRKTILSVETAVTAMDDVVTEHYADAPLDDPEVDKQIDRWVCAFATIDATLLFGWKKLHYIEEGPPKVKASAVGEWVAWAFELAESIMILVGLAELYGLDTSPLDPAFDALSDFITPPEDPPEDLDCGEAFQ